MLNTQNPMPQKNGYKRFYRTLTLIRELKALGYPYEAHKDTIWLTAQTLDKKHEYRLKIDGAIDCYKMYMARWNQMGQADMFYTWELRATTGAELLVNLVTRQILPPYFMPIGSIKRVTDAE